MLAPLLAGTAVVVAACGGGSASTTSSGAAATSTTAATASATASAASAKSRIKHNWTEFFNASTSNAKRLAVLQNAQQYKQVIIAQSKNPLARQSTAKVNGITLTAPDKATVHYTVLVAGKPALKNQTGTAIKSGGTWKVSDKSFCALLGMEGSKPAVCPKS